MTEQAKGSADIHGNRRIHSAVIISINAERQWQRRGGGGGTGVWESFWGWGRVGLRRWGRLSGSERHVEVQSGVGLI